MKFGFQFGGLKEIPHITMQFDFTLIGSPKINLGGKY